MTQILVLSQSQIDAYLKCKQAYGYAYIQQLQPKKPPVGIDRGNTGHKFLEVFLTSIKNGETIDVAREKAMQAIVLMNHSEMLLPLLLRWVNEVFPRLGWRIVAVEKEFRLPITPTLIYPLKVDAIVEVKGRLVIIDHKFLYDPYTAEDLSIMPQLPKYIGTLRALKIPISYAQYNIIRTRKTEVDNYTQPKVEPTAKAIQTHMQEQITIMKEIERGEFIVSRTASSYNCKGCKFLELCVAELNGEETKYIRAMSYEPNTYGYTEEI